MAVSRAFHPLRVAKIIDETHDAKSIVFEVPLALEEAFHYRAGQFLTLELTYAGLQLRRCYSLSSSPDCDSEHKVTVKRVLAGRGSNLINDELRVGSVVPVLQPEGRFVLRDDAGDAPLVLFAGGSGITPIISIIKTALATTSRRIGLVYANRDARSVIFHSELAALATKHAARLRIAYRLDDTHGFLRDVDVRALLGEVLPGATQPDCYLCGPGAFMEVVERGLAGAGVDGARIHIERFASLADEGLTPRPEAGPAPATATAAASPRDGDGIPDMIDVELLGEKHRVPYVAGKKILHAVRDAGLDPPYSCEEGFCGCCTARLVEGRVSMDATDALTEDEKKNGLILTCQARPLTRVCSVRYVD